MRRFGVKRMVSLVSNVSSGCYVVRADVLCFPTACGTGRKSEGGEGGGELASVDGFGTATVRGPDSEKMLSFLLTLICHGHVALFLGSYFFSDGTTREPYGSGQCLG